MDFYKKIEFKTGLAIVGCIGCVSLYMFYNRKPKPTITFEKPSQPIIYYKKMTKTAIIPVRSEKNGIHMNLYSDGIYRISPNCEVTIRTGIMCRTLGDDCYLSVVPSPSVRDDIRVRAGENVGNANFEGELTIIASNNSDQTANVQPNAEIARLCLIQVCRPQIVDQTEKN